jgi:hypothetical protein|tara:strand:- start:14910 stop:15830 length:921 start_codon:yes stop_codon:yes gene_type:complete
MKKIIYLFLSVALLVSCSNDKQVVKKTPEVNITTAVNPADGLDFKLVGALFQEGKVTNAETLESELNREGGINNLDLNGDDKTDYINVSENEAVGTFRSFDLTTGDEADATFIGSVEVEKAADGNFNIHMSGSEEIYGANSHYQVSHRPSVGQMMLYSWMFSPRPRYYHRPYYMGHYPSYYHPIRVVPMGAYASRTSVQRTTTSTSVTKSKTPYKSKTKSANKGKTSASTKAKMAKAQKASARSKASTSKGKSFSKKNTNTGYKGGGFANKKKTTSSTAKPKPKPRAKPRSRSSSSRSSSGRSRRK